MRQSAAMRAAFAWLGLAAATATIACGSGSGDPFDDTEATGGSAAGHAGGGAAGIGGAGWGGGTSNGKGGGTAASGCSKVDFLFIVDNSVSMEDQQQALITSFPGFMSAIEQTVAASDYHILIVDTDEWGRCDTANPWSGMDPTSSTCNGYVKSTSFEECDRTRGAGVLHPAGEFASNKPCAPQGGKRYIVAGEPDLEGTFACMAQVGVAGHPAERPMDAMMAALSSKLNAPDGCNAGFLRQDAILVITFISDDPNYEDSGTPQEWYDAVVAAKGGNADSVVVLGLTPDFAGCQDGKGPPKGAHWSEFIALWGSKGLEASVCDADYSPLFQQAVSIVDQTCDEFEEPS